MSVQDAHKVFDEMPQPNVITWNTIITACVHSRQLNEAVRLFSELNKSEISLDAFSYTATLTAVGRLCLLKLGMSIHSQIVKHGLDLVTCVVNCLIDMYGKCGAVEEAANAFNNLVDKDLISCNSVISAAIRSQRIDLAFKYFNSMAYPDTISYNVLINGLVQFGTMEDAIRLFKSIPSTNTCSWNAIITGYVNRNRTQESLDFLKTMQKEGVEMDEYTFSSILSGIAQLSALTWGMLLHCLIMKSGFDSSVVVGTALIDMYSKCGEVDEAELAFESLPSKNIITWNTIISGFAHNGESKKLIQHLEKMKNVNDLKLDEITLLCVLAACAHNQMPLETAYEYFVAIIKENNILPTVEHLTAMIRLMGRNDEVWRAEKMINELGFRSCGPVWKALLGACRACGDMGVAKKAAEKVIELGGDREFAYVVLSNIDAARGRWVEAGEFREKMRSKGIEKETGFSWIEV